MDNSQYKEIVLKIATPLIVGKPVFDDKGNLKDIETVFTNEAFNKPFHDSVLEGDKLTEKIGELSKDVSWFEIFTEALKTHVPYSTVFYSELLSKWLLLKINVTDSDLIITSFTDISQQKEIEKQLRFNAYHDAMTEIPNRTKLTLDLGNLINSQKDTEKKVGVILINIDNMKFVNDSQGHSRGDEIIKKSVTLLKKFQKTGLTAYRFDGDEFVIIVQDASSKDSLINIGDAILECFNSSGIGFSGGIAVFPDDASTDDELLRYADMAMTDAKKGGKNNVTLYRSVMRDKFMTRINLQTHLNDALDRNIFQMYFQPQFNVNSGELRGFEALLRWHDEELGWVNPEQFIPIAEETKLIIPMGDWILETAIKTLAKWYEEYNFRGIMSVNVSPIQLKNPNFIFTLQNLVKQYNIVPQNLEIEITEGVLIENKEDTVNLLKQIRDMGIGISLDDFGTGYSSLSYLQILPITTLKIDKSFIANITASDGVEANITDSIVSMVTKMGLDTIAEGVEHNEQLELLKKIKCQNIQGFLRGKPMPADRCESVLAGDKNAILTILNDN